MSKSDESVYVFYEKDISSYEERDLFYPIQKDLSNAYYIDVKEG